MLSFRRIAGALGASLLLSSCLGGWGFRHDETLDGPWRVVAVDDMSDMILCRSDEPSFCAGDGLPGPTVFAAGSSERYIVTAAHESEFHRGQVPAFYYIVRQKGDPLERDSVIKGPLLQADFEREKARLGLPEFSIVFEELQ